MEIDTTSPTDQVLPRVEPPRSETTSTDNKQPQEKNSITNVVETAIKLAGIAGAISAIMGLPAVSLHFKNLGIPSYYIDYQLILTAGIAPVIVLALVALYLAAVLQQASGDRSPLLSLVMIPLIVPVLPFLFVGLIAYVLLLAWGVTWLVTYPFRNSNAITLSNREMLYIATALILVVVVVYLLRNHLFKLRPVRRLIYWLSSFDLTRHHGAITSQAQPAPDLSETSSSARTDVSKSSRRESQSTEEKANEWLRLLPFMWLGVPIMSIGLLFAIKGVVYIWDPYLTGVLSLENIFWAGIGLGIMYATAMSSIAWQMFLSVGKKETKNKGIIIATASLLIAGAFSITLYSFKIYPSLGQVWGGGRPEPVIVWVDESDLPSVIQLNDILTSASISQDNSLVKIGPIPALTVGKQIILLEYSQSSPRALVIPLDNLKMVAQDTDP